MIDCTPEGGNDDHVVESSEGPAPLLEPGTSGGTVSSECPVSNRRGSSSSLSKLFSAEKEKKSKKKTRKENCLTFLWTIELIPQDGEEDSIT